MLAEVFGLFGLIVFLLFVFAETQGKTMLGVFASLMMLLLGIWVIVEPIYFKVAEHITGTETTLKNETNTAGNLTSSSIKTYNVTSNSTYVPPSDPSFTPLSYSGIIGLALVLLSMFGMLHYGLRVGKEING